MAIAKNNKINILAQNGNRIIDIAFVVFCIFISLDYNYNITSLRVPIHDGAIYLQNSHNWLEGKPLGVDFFRPPLLSWIIAGIWSMTGENWIIVKGLQSFFTIGAGIVLYLLLKKNKSGPFAFGVASLTMINETVFYFSTQIVTEGLALFFLVMTLYFVKSENKNYWFLAGITMGLTFGSRYPILLQAVVIVLLQSIITRKPQLLLRVASTAIPVMVFVIMAVYLKAGEFEMALAKDSSLTIFLSPFYLLNSINIWGFCFLLVPIALLHRRTYSDSFNFIFIGWFVISLLFWSSSTANFQFRFTIQYTPAVYFLVLLGIENIFKENIIYNNVLSRSSIKECLDGINGFIRTFKRKYRYDILGRWE